jgi:hypothetical protein
MSPFAVTGGWLLTMGTMKRGFKNLRQIWELLIVENWHLTDLFCSPPASAPTQPIFAPIYTKYGAIPFCDDNPIDIWRLGSVNAQLSGCSPPAGGNAM